MIRHNWGQTKPVLGSQIDFSHPLSQGLVGCWLMNEGGGLKTNNLANYPSSNGTISGAKFISGRKGRTLDFNATNRDYVNVASNLGSPKDITIVTQFELDAVDAGLDRSDMISFNDRLGIFFTSGASTNQGFFYDGVAWQAVPFNYVFAGQGVKTIGYTIKGGQSNQKVYLEGKLQNSTTIAGNISYTTPNLFFGRHPTADTVDFDGRIYYIYIYSRALSPSEIQSLYIAPYQMIAPRKRFIIDMSGGTPEPPSTVTPYGYLSCNKGFW